MTNPAATNKHLAFEALVDKLCSENFRIARFRIVAELVERGITPETMPA